MMSQHGLKTDPNSIKALEGHFTRYLEQQSGQVGQKAGPRVERLRSEQGRTRQKGDRRMPQNSSPHPRRRRSPSPGGSSDDDDEKHGGHPSNSRSPRYQGVSRSFLQNDASRVQDNILNDTWQKIMQHSRTCVIPGRAAGGQEFPVIPAEDHDILSDALSETYLTDDAGGVMSEGDGADPSERRRPSSDDEDNNQESSGREEATSSSRSLARQTANSRARSRKTGNRDRRPKTVRRTSREPKTKKGPAQRKISGYLLSGHILGRGVSSQVELGLDPRDNQLMALKVIRKFAKVDKHAESDQSRRKELKAARKKQNMLQLAMAEREILALSRLRHPNIIRISAYDVDANYPPIEGEDPYIEAILISLEYLQGGDLFDYISNTGALESRTARTYWKQLVDALQCCHQQGVAHRDIKLENIMFDRKYQLKLCDFGISATFNPRSNEPMNEHVGTKVGGYMAPELVERLPYDGCAADVWSAGAVLFVMLAGVPPMEEASPTDWYFVQIRNKQWVRFWKQHNNSVFDSQPVKDMFFGIFETDFKRRFTIEQIKACEWHRKKHLTDEKLQQAMGDRFKKIKSEKPIELILREWESKVGRSFQPTHDRDPRMQS